MLLEAQNRREITHFTAACGRAYTGVSVVTVYNALCMSYVQYETGLSASVHNVSNIIKSIAIILNLKHQVEPVESVSHLRVHVHSRGP